MATKKADTNKLSAKEQQAIAAATESLWAGRTSPYKVADALLAIWKAAMPRNQKWKDEPWAPYTTGWRVE